MASEHPPAVKAYLERIGAEVLNFKRAIIKLHMGPYYREKALIKIYDDGTVTSSVLEYAPTKDEASAMKYELKGMEFPKIVRVRNVDGLVETIRRLCGGREPGDLFEFIDRRTEEVLHVQERCAPKAFYPWSMLSTGEWVMMEPDIGLPFWKPRGLPWGNKPKIMIHEGAKAARAADRIVRERIDSHPWYETLREYLHFGMIGGALAPHRTNYEELRAEGAEEIVYVCDNDAPGIAAVKEVSRAWGGSLKKIIFGKAFPDSWDMADPVPPEMIVRGRYLGAALKDMIRPATWATEMVAGERKGGRPSIVIRPEFRNEWFSTVRPEAFVHKDFPGKIWSTSEFNNVVAPFSHSDDTARLMKRELNGKAAVLKYIPSLKNGLYSGGTDGLFINTYVGSRVVAEKGDCGPWLDFMDKLVVDQDDRHELKRWIATLVTRPDIRMKYGILLISEMQGVGKGTLAEHILLPLVGEHNVSSPSEQQLIESAFNTWLAHKRLAIVHEIYAGNSSKPYDRLKSAITDDYIEVNAKYQAQYQIENWIHILACSNSLRALRVKEDDRRWFIPKVNETRPEDNEPDYWKKLHEWLKEDGGLGKILWWANEFIASKEGGIVMRGERPPYNYTKRAVIEENYSPGMRLIERTLAYWKEGAGDREFLLDGDVVRMIKDVLHGGREDGKVEKQSTVRSIARKVGLFVGETKASVPSWGSATWGARVISKSTEIARMTPGELNKSGLVPSGLEVLQKAVSL